MLLDPFEEQFHAPSVAVYLGDCLDGSSQIIGQEYIFATVLGIDADYFTECFRAIL